MAKKTQQSKAPPKAASKTAEPKTKASKTKASKTAEPKPALPKQEERMANWEIFFSRQRNPILRSQLITSMMAGNPLEVDRLPTAMLLDAVVLAMAMRNYHEAEVIDDYTALVRRVDAAWQDPMWTSRTFDQYHCNAASFIVRMGNTQFVAYEDLYVPKYAEQLLAQNVPDYFDHELEEAA